METSKILQIIEITTVTVQNETFFFDAERIKTFLTYVMLKCSARSFGYNVNKKKFSSRNKQL